MSLIRVIEDIEGNIYLVTQMFDENGKDVNDTALAESIVIRFRDRFEAISTKVVAVQTVQ